MLSAVRAGLAELPLAHPLTQPYSLPISPLEAALAGAAFVLAIAFAWPIAHGTEPPSERWDLRAASWAGSLSAAQWVARLAAVLVLGLAVAAGRGGVDDELENLAPALIVGVTWPLLVLASCVLGAVWRWTDPWDAGARPLTRGQRDEVPEHVWPAVLLALSWVWYLSAYNQPLDPRSVGALVALYTIVTVAGCLALGRVRWLASCEPLGIVLSWMALLRRRRLSHWRPPRGAEALLGVLAGGLLFGALRRSEVWGDLNTVEHATLVATLGLLGSCAAIGWLLTFVARTGTHAATARAAVPAVAAIVLAVAMDRNRLSTSVQLLPHLFGDPFGEGWDLFGRATSGLDPAPLGVKGLLIAQIGVLLLGHATGAVVLARRTARRARAPVATGLAILAYVSVVALAAH